MSWDVMIFNYGGKPPQPEEMDDTPPKPLGSPKKVQAAIAKHLPGVVWEENGVGLLTGNGYSVEFDADADDPIADMMMSVRGSQGPIPTLLAMAEDCKWSLLDCSTGEFIDPALGIPGNKAKSPKSPDNPGDGGGSDKSPKRKNKAE